MNNESEFDFETSFPPLGHPEHHFNKYPNHPWLKSEEEIMNWLNKVNEYICVENITIHKDLTVSISCDFVINFKTYSKYELLDKIIVQFRDVEFFKCSEHKLNSFIGTPYNVRKMELDRNELGDWEGLSENVSHILDLEHNFFSSFEEMPDFKFKDSLEIIMKNNVYLKDWDGFTACSEIHLGGKFTNKDVDNILINSAPSSINKIRYYEDYVGKSIDMINLRNEQRRIKQSIQNKKNIENIICDKSDVKKRKI